jgi:hypothetical protein
MPFRPASAAPGWRCLLLLLLLASLANGRDAAAEPLAARREDPRLLAR